MDRRSFLRGAGGAAIGLPFLEAFARAAPPRKRLLVFQIPNGVIKESFYPQGSDADFTLARIMAPLEPHKKDLIVLRHVDSPSTKTHNVLPTLTGAVTLGPRASSIDQLFGNERPGSAFRSLQFAVNCQKDYFTYSAGQPVPPENFPERMFERMFGVKPAGADRTYEYRKSVLDAVKDSIDQIGRQLGAADRERLDRHLTSIRSIENRLTAAPAVATAAAGCKPVAPPMVQVKTGGYRYDGKYNLVGEAQIPLMVQAIACGVTNVATIQWSDTFANAPHWTFLGINAGEHDIHHGSDPNKREVRTRELEYYVTQFEKLISGLKACPEEGGSVFSNSVVLFCSEMSDGIAHDNRDLPYLIAGGAGGALRTGRIFDARGAKNTQFLVTLLAALLGRDPASLPPFGEPGYFSPIAGLLP